MFITDFTKFPISTLRGHLTSKVASSQSPLLVIQTCFPLLGHLSSEVLIHVEGQVKRTTLGAFL